MNGILIKAIAGFYYVKAGDTVFECKARGHFKKQNISPTPGDKVEISVMENNKGVLESVLPRKNYFYRPSVANIDKLFIVSSYVTPAPNTYIIDTLTVLCRKSNIEPIVVFNKCDMGDFSEYTDIYNSIGIRTYTVSAHTGDGLDCLKKELNGCICAFTGNSGVGKSSLLNVLFPELSIQTGDVSQKLGRGRHTTREVTLYESDNGYVADTPGFSALEINNGQNIEMHELQDLFFEFGDYTDGCKFCSCSHTVEKGCAVIDAVNKGKIPKSRHESYCQMYSELKEADKNKYK